MTNSLKDKQAFYRNDLYEKDRAGFDLYEASPKFKAMKESLSELLDSHDEACRFDHNRSCQTHLDFSGDGRCFVADARETLRAIEGGRMSTCICGEINFRNCPVHNDMNEEKK